MPKLNNRVPKYCRHRGSGQAVVALSGQDIYVGQYGSPASRAKYDRLIAEWIGAGRRLPTDPNAITIAEVVAAFRRHAQTYYGADSKAAANIDGSLRPVVKLYGRTAANEFGPLRLKTVREQFISGGRVRANINRHITRIRGVFKWAAENELIPADVFHGLMAVRGLRRGKSGAVEGEPVKPVPVEHVEAVIPHGSGRIIKGWAQNRDAQGWFTDCVATLPLHKSHYFLISSGTQTERSEWRTGVHSRAIAFARSTRLAWIGCPIGRNDPKLAIRSAEPQRSQCPEEYTH